MRGQVVASVKIGLADQTHWQRHRQKIDEALD